MANAIYMSPEIKAKLIEDFAKSLDGSPVFNGGVKYEKTLKYEDKRTATIQYTAKAWFRTIMLVETQAKEVGWYGVCKRDEEDPTVFHIEDILVYPQAVTGTTINPDALKQVEWENSLDDDTFNNMRFHGHSHVNMGVFSSGTDEEFRRCRLSQLREDEFFVFQVFNKRGEIHSAIYDYANNVMYENTDIETVVECESMDIWATYKKVATALVGTDTDKVMEATMAFVECGVGEIIADAKAKVVPDTSYGKKVTTIPTTTTTTKKPDTKPTTKPEAEASKPKSNEDAIREGVSEEMQTVINDPLGYWDGNRGSLYGGHGYGGYYYGGGWDDYYD